MSNQYPSNFSSLLNKHNLSVIKARGHSPSLTNSHSMDSSSRSGAALSSEENGTEYQKSVILSFPHGVRNGSNDLYYGKEFHNDPLDMNGSFSSQNKHSNPKEFPSLAQRSVWPHGGGGGGALNSNSPHSSYVTMSPASKNYVSATSGKSSSLFDGFGGNLSSNVPVSEFSIEKEDFPALPSQSNLPNVSSAPSLALDANVNARYDSSMTSGSALLDMASSNSLESQQMQQQQQQHRNHMQGFGSKLVGGNVSNEQLYATTPARTMKNLYSNANTASSFSQHSSSHLLNSSSLRPLLGSHAGNSMPQSTASFHSVMSSAPMNSPHNNSASIPNNNVPPPSGPMSLEDSIQMSDSRKMCFFPQSGMIENVPNSMLHDEFGLCALGVIKHHPPATIPGEEMKDLLTFNKNKTTPLLYQNLQSPLQGTFPGRPQDMDWLVPEEYHIRHRFYKQLADLKVSQLSEETLFWIFYNCCGEDAQAVAAKALFTRSWCYNVELRLWIQRCPHQESRTTYRDDAGETSTYFVWDAIEWKKKTRQLQIRYRDLDHPSDMCCEKLQVATNMLGAQGQPRSAIVTSGLPGSQPHLQHLVSNNLPIPSGSIQSAVGGVSSAAVRGRHPGSTMNSQQGHAPSPQVTS